MLGTDTAASAGLHRAHNQELNAVDLLGIGVGNISHLRIEFEELIEFIGARPLLHQLAHLGDGDDGVDLFLAEAQRQAQICVRIHVGRENGASFFSVQSAESGGQGCLAHAALAGNSDFHVPVPSCGVRFAEMCLLYNRYIRCPVRRASSR